MRRRIDSADRLVEGACDDVTVEDDDGTDRHFAGVDCQLLPARAPRACSRRAT
jgi:hypothetical protein